MPTTTSISNTEIIETNRVIDEKTPIIVATGTNSINNNLYETKRVEKITSLGSLGGESREYASPGGVRLNNTNIVDTLKTTVENTYRPVQPVVSTTILPSVPVITTSVPQTTTTVIRTQSPSKIINNTNTLYNSQYQNALINSTVTMGQPKAVTTVTRN